MGKLRILLSNDDGVNAPGLAALADIFREIADLDIIAPDRNKSGASNSLTLQTPLRPHILRNGYISVEGTPTDCVHLALTGFLQHRPDFVVAGINAGANLGDDVIYSGTVAAAMEARILGIPSIAVSLHESATHYKTAAIVARQIIERLQKDPLPSASILNVNVPNLPLDQLRGFEVARLGTRHNADPTIKMEDPRGQEIYWFGPPGPGADAGPGTDFNAVKSGFVSITPIHVDLTYYSAFEKVSEWTMGLVVGEK
jgi:5'-nucleotidase